MRVGFIGLGNMGYPIAMNINKKLKTIVWNRTLSVAQKHNRYVNNIIDLPKQTDIILTCLPTYKEVESVMEYILPYLSHHTIIDLTSSKPEAQKRLYGKLKDKNISFLDAPVSGGMDKAKTGTLSCMISGDEDGYLETKSVLETFSKPTYVGDIGNASAIKAINNIMNISHLCIAAEGLSALQKYGIDINTSLEIINKSSGRSLMTQERIPEHILRRNYNYGFSLKLMKKDVGNALELIEDPIMFANIQSLIDKSLERYGNKADYTEVTKLYLN